MELIFKLQRLYEYFYVNRRVGHSTLLKTGTKNSQSEFLVLTYSPDDYTHLEVRKDQIVPWHGTLSKLKGETKPLVIDNAAMHKILEESINEINRLDEENKNLKAKLGLINRIIAND